jgi:flavin-dependent dehydrogenase
MLANETKLKEFDTQLREYDAVIMGAGIAGICQARHLLLNIPEIRVAIVDPRPAERTVKDAKIGESTVEVSTLFLGKELGLYDYLIENHPPKYGLNFHWPKESTKTNDLDDYHHLWATRQPSLASVIIKRAKFETDVLKMVINMGADFYYGQVKDVDITEADKANTVNVKLKDGKYVDLKTSHLIDAAGRKFIIGQKTNNLILEPEDLYGLSNGSAWVRVKNVDRTIFHDGYDPDSCTCSHYYATNHWMGNGHWVWMIPTDVDSQELSVGLVHHNSVIPAESVRTKKDFYAFLKANHNLLYQLVESGEDIDFHYLPRIAHKSKTIYSRDNWYVIGDAAAMFDPFYSMGMTMMSFQIESTTEIVRSKLAKEAIAEKKRSVYNTFTINMVERNNHLISHHAKHLGHASIMTWRIYLENMWWFGLIVPMFLGKWHLDLGFLRKLGKGGRGVVTSKTLDAVYEQFNKLLEKKSSNIGFMYTHRADELPFGYIITKDFDNYIGLSKYEPNHCNIYKEMKNTYFFVALWYIKFLWKAFGLLSLLSPKNIKLIALLLKASVESAFDAWVHERKMANVPTNSKIAAQKEEFKTYQPQLDLQPWRDKSASI